jgi:hypothetical protein
LHQLNDRIDFISEAVKKTNAKNNSNVIWGKVLVLVAALKENSAGK